MSARLLFDVGDYAAYRDYRQRWVLCVVVEATREFVVVERRVGERTLTTRFGGGAPLGLERLSRVRWRGNRWSAV